MVVVDWVGMRGGTMLVLVIDIWARRRHGLPRVL